MRHSVSQSTPYTYLYQSGEYFVRVRGVGPWLVQLEWDFKQETTGQWTLALPDWADPTRMITFAGSLYDTNSHALLDHTAYGFVDGNNRVSFQAGAAIAGARNCGTAVWAVRNAAVYEP